MPRCLPDPQKITKILILLHFVSLAFFSTHEVFFFVVTTLVSGCVLVHSRVAMILVGLMPEGYSWVWGMPWTYFEGF